MSMCDPLSFTVHHAKALPHPDGNSYIGAMPTEFYDCFPYDLEFPSQPLIISVLHQHLFPLVTTNWKNPERLFRQLKQVQINALKSNCLVSTACSSQLPAPSPLLAILLLIKSTIKLHRQVHLQEPHMSMHHPIHLRNGVPQVELFPQPDLKIILTN